MIRSYLAAAAALAMMTGVAVAQTSSSSTTSTQSTTATPAPVYGGSSSSSSQQTTNQRWRHGGQDADLFEWHRHHARRRPRDDTQVNRDHHRPLTAPQHCKPDGPAWPVSSR